MAREIVGWDIGGAHVKVVAMDENGTIKAVMQRLCPLWQGLEHLKTAVEDIKARLQLSANGLHALTMTGEMVDLFAGRDDGVKQILAVMADYLGGLEVLIFAGRHGLMALEQITPAYYPAIASANWLASADWAAQTSSTDGLFIDIGSTTTDILAINNGQVLIEGLTDYDRLCSQELIYTGIVRTPIMAVAQMVVDQGRGVGIMAEYFATMADVYRLTGELNEAHDLTPTADGAGKTETESARRLARMIGCDYDESELTRWRQLAWQIKEMQLAKLISAAQQVLRQQEKSATLTIVGAGIGRFLACQIAQRLSCRYIDFNQLAPHFTADRNLSPADCAPAAALAFLAAKAS
jgi:probable H4MPT-linked C1 transfer pathway protein